MPFRNLDVAAYIGEPPEFRYEGGMFHVTQRYSDSCIIERVMPPHVFMLALKRAADCAALHFRGGAEVISLAKKIEERAARH